MARRDRESVYDSDTHDLLFGDEDQGGESQGSDAADAGDATFAADRDRPRPPGGRSRLEARRAERHHHRGRVLGISAVVLLVVLAAAVYFIGVPVYRYFSPADYDGNGSGAVIVTVHANDGASQIGTILEQAGVVASDRAFIDAADSNSRSQNIQPGSYRLRKGMAADRALALLLDPSSRVNSDTVVAEGANVFRIEQILASPRCDSGSRTGSVCGLGVPKAQIVKVLQNVRNLGVPTDYLPSGKTPTTVEGFLYPATYSFDDETTLTEALQQMVGKFTDVARSNQFSTAAKALNLTPYQALTLASMIQAEAKFPEDMPKVARVILNRRAQGTPLKIDAASVYAAELAGVDPKSVNYATIDSPYNTYRNAGLPPTPISNPGAEALKAAVTPAQGNWTFYVNGDAQGHLYFTNSEADFIKAQKRCADSGWGCAQP